MSMWNASPVGVAYRSHAPNDSEAVTPAIGPLPATYLSGSASGDAFSAVWRTVTGLVHRLGSHRNRPLSSRAPNG
jgi:hypothetical protein